MYNSEGAKKHMEISLILTVFGNTVAFGERLWYDYKNMVK